MTRHTITFTPRLMQAAASAQYLGVSVTKFLGLGIPAKADGGNVLYDVRDLDAYADSLPYRGQEVEENTCADVFGAASS